MTDGTQVLALPWIESHCYLMSQVLMDSELVKTSIRSISTGRRVGGTGDMEEGRRWLLASERDTPLRNRRQRPVRIHDLILEKVKQVLKCQVVFKMLCIFFSMVYKVELNIFIKKVTQIISLIQLTRNIKFTGIVVYAQICLAF